MKYRTRAREFEVTDLHNADDAMSPGAYVTMTIDGQQYAIHADEVVVSDGTHTSVVPRHWFEMFCEPVPEEPVEAVVAEPEEEDEPRTDTLTRVRRGNR